jgi:predicted GNAT family acetyltransferase
MPDSLPPVQHDPQSEQFLINLEGQQNAKLDYTRKVEGERTVLDLKATFVPPGRRNQGLATKIVLNAFREAEAQGYKIRPSCPFTEALLQRKPAFQHLRVDEKAS